MSHVGASSSPCPTRATICRSRTQVIRSSTSSSTSSDDASAPSTSSSSADQQHPLQPSRRAALAGALSVVATATLPFASRPPPAFARAGANDKAVGSYLPPAPSSMNVPEGYVLYAPGARDTPSTRAGVIKPPLYSWALHPSMIRQPIVNALTGDFCFPNCVEPWYEAVFSDPSIGKVFLCCVILKKLLPSSRDDGGGATVNTLGAPPDVARALGPLFTGQGYEDEDLLVANERTADGDGEKFYDLELLASLADKTGPHRLASVTVKGPIVYLMVGCANEKQWKGGGEAALRAMVQSFRA